MPISLSPEHGRDGDAQTPAPNSPGAGVFESQDRSGWPIAISLISRQVDREASDFRAWRDDLRHWGDGLEERTENLSERLSVVEDRVESSKVLKAEIAALRDRAELAEARLGQMEILRGKIDTRRMVSLGVLAATILGAYDRFRVEPLERREANTAAQPPHSDYSAPPESRPKENLHRLNDLSVDNGAA